VIARLLTHEDSPRRVLLVGATVIAAAMLVLAIREAIHPSALLTTPAAPPRLAALDLALPATPTDFALVLEKPLLYATRTFYVAPPPSSEPVAPPVPQYRLAGVLVTPARPAVATVIQGTTGRVLRIQPGDALDGWAVESVTLTEVGLVLGSTRAILACEGTGPSSAAPAGSPGGLQRIAVGAMRRSRTKSSGVRLLTAGGSEAALLAPVPRINDAAVDTAPRLFRPPPP
jgi:hypothetical protein